METENFAQLQQYFEKYKPQIESALREHAPSAVPELGGVQLNEAIEYALTSDERRIYAVLTLLGAELFGGKTEIFLPAAAAVEFINASYAVSEYLPYEDPSPRMRGKTSLAKEFGAGFAIRVTIQLLNASYGLVFVNHRGFPERAMQAHAEIVECIAVSQEAVGSSPNEALVRLALRIGAILAGANYLELAQISRFGDFLDDALLFYDARTIEEAKRILIENFPSSEARTCLIQLTDFLAVEEA